MFCGVCNTENNISYCGYKDVICIYLAFNNALNIETEDFQIELNLKNNEIFKDITFSRKQNNTWYKYCIQVAHKNELSLEILLNDIERITLENTNVLQRSVWNLILFTNAKIKKQPNFHVRNVRSTDFIISASLATAFKLHQLAEVYRNLRNVRGINICEKLIFLESAPDEARMKEIVCDLIKKHFSSPEQWLMEKMMCYMERQFKSGSVINKKDFLLEISKLLLNDENINYLVNINKFNVDFSSECLNNLASFIRGKPRAKYIESEDSLELLKQKIKRCTLIDNSLLCMTGSSVITYEKLLEVYFERRQTTTLVIENDEDDIWSFLRTHLRNVNFVIISKTMDPDKIREIKRSYPDLRERTDVTNFTDLAEASKNFILNRVISFQGKPVIFKAILRDLPEVVSHIKGRFLLDIITKEQVTLGPQLDQVSDSLVSRILCTKQDNISQNRTPDNLEPNPNGSDELLSPLLVNMVNKKLQDLNKCNETNTYKNVNSKVLFRDMDLLQKRKRFVCISGERGSGKTTLLRKWANLIKQRHPEKLILFYNTVTTMVKDMNGVIQMTKHNLGVGDEKFNEHFIKSCFLSKNKVTVLIDTNYYSDKEKSFVKILLENTNVEQIIVSSISNELGSYKIQPLSTDEQLKLCIDFFKNRYPDVNVETTIKFVDKIVNLLNTLQKVSKGNPLNIRLMCEIFLEEFLLFSKSQEFEIPNNINYFSMYEKYFKSKLNEYNNPSKIEETLMMTAVARLPDSPIAIEGITADIKEMISSKCSFISEDGKPHFEYETIADYLFALWIVRNFSDNQKFISTFFEDTQWKVVHQFVDFMLAKNSSFLTRILNHDLLRNDPQEDGYIDDGGRNSLHVAVSCSNLEAVRKLVQEKDLTFCSATDVLLNWQPLHYIRDFHHKPNQIILGILLEKGCNKEILSETLKLDDYMLKSLILTAIENNFIELFSYLLTREENEILNKDFEFDTDKIALVKISRNLTVVELAAAFGSETILKILVESIQCKNSLGKALIIAVRNNRETCVDVLLDEGANVNYVENGVTALGVAVHCGFFHVTERLIRRNADLNMIQYSDTISGAPIHISIEKGYDDISILLIQSGARLQLISLKGESAVMAAVRLKRDNVLRSLYDKTKITESYAIIVPSIPYAVANNWISVSSLTATMVQTRDNFGRILFHYLSHSDNDDLVQSLLRENVELDVQDEYGVTPLHSAVRANNLKLTELLVKKGCNVNTEDEDGLTPLMDSCNKSENIINILIKHGAAINYKNKHNYTSLHKAVLAQDQNAVKVLLENGADVNAFNIYGETPLICAADLSNVDIAVVLITNGALINMKDQHGTTALHRAIRKRNFSLVSHLLENGADVNITFENGETPLIYATCEFDEDVVSLLINNFANVNQANKHGDSPLHMAFYYNKPNIVNLLLKNEADINATNNEGEAPFMFADNVQTIDPVK